MLCLLCDGSLSVSSKVRSLASGASSRRVKIDRPYQRGPWHDIGGAGASAPERKRSQAGRDREVSQRGVGPDSRCSRPLNRLALFKRPSLLKINAGRLFKSAVPLHCRRRWSRCQIDRFVARAARQRNIGRFLVDSSAMPMARAAIGLSVRKLAAAAKISPETVIRFEGGIIRQRTIDSLRQVLEAAGLEFTDGRSYEC